MSVHIKCKLLTGVDLYTGRALAAELIDMIKDGTQRVEVAGGIRREKPFPHDIELVAVPKYESTFVEGLFGRERGADSNLLDGRMNEFAKRRSISPAPSEARGRRAPFSPSVDRETRRYRPAPALLESGDFFGVDQHIWIDTYDLYPRPEAQDGMRLDDYD